MEKEIEEIITESIASFFGTIKKGIDKLKPKSSISNSKNNSLEDNEINSEFKKYLNSLKNPNDLFSGKFKKLKNGSSEGEYLYWTYSQYKDASEYFNKNKKSFTEEEWTQYSANARSALDLFVKEMTKTFKPGTSEYYKEKYFTKEFSKYSRTDNKRFSFDNIVNSSKDITQNARQFKSQFNLNDNDIAIKIDPISLESSFSIKGHSGNYVSVISASDFQKYASGKISSSYLVEKYLSKELSRNILKEQYKPYLDSLKNKEDLTSGDMSRLPRGSVYFEYQKYRSLRDELGRWANNGNLETYKEKKLDTIDALNNFLGKMRETLSPLEPNTKWGIDSDFVMNEMSTINNPPKFSNSNKQSNTGNNNSLNSVQPQSQNIKHGKGMKL